jgi:hypothetical protein
MCLPVYQFIVYWLWRFTVSFRQHYYEGSQGLASSNVLPLHEHDQVKQVNPGSYYSYIIMFSAVACSDKDNKRLRAFPFKDPLIACKTDEPV